MFETADEHERAVSSYGQGKTVGHAIPCASCGAWFRTTDWPPAICPSCRERPSTAPTSPEQTT